MRTPKKLNYEDVPGVKQAVKDLIKSLLRKFYIRPVQALERRMGPHPLRKGFVRKMYLSYYRLPIDPIITNEKGIAGVTIVASYTDADKGYLPGFIDSCDAFEKIVLYHDKTKHNNFKYNESYRFQLLVAAARRNGAKWVLIGSPKTRFSAEFREQVAPYVEKYKNKPVVLVLNERFLWQNFDQYINSKSKAHQNLTIKKFFSITDNMIFDNQPIHATQFPINYTKHVDTGASRYYLGRFNQSILNKKAQFYSTKDGLDYSWLKDTTKPRAHHEHILGISEYERKELL